MAIKKKIIKKAESVEKYTGPSVVLITGAAGYVGGMLCDQFLENPDIKEIIAIDKEEMPELLKNKKKITWITSELSGNDWQKIAEIKKPEVVIHSAWQAEELYEEKELQRRLNLDASEKVFDFVFNSPFVKKIIYFSTSIVYGALDNNKTENLFIEGDMMRENDHLLGSEKKEAEIMLANKYSDTGKTKTVFILRPTVIMGPRGRYMVKKNILYRLLCDIFPMVPIANNDCGIQCVHEDDLTNIVAILTFNNVPGKYEVFNLSSDDIIYGKELAGLFKKEITWLPPIIIRIIFFFAWHLSQGKIPTGIGVWKFFCYPLYVDGSKITKLLKYPYLYSSMDALTKDEGRYEYSAPVVVEEKQSEEKKKVSRDK